MREKSEMTLREAAQQALDALELGCTDHDGNPVDLVGPAITALRSALAEDAMQRLTDVQQEMEAIINEMETVEPVAWMRVDRGHVDFHRHPGYLPLYTAPLKREPLTESFLEELAEKHVTNCYFNTLTYARAIERAHEIGGEE